MYVEIRRRKQRKKGAGGGKREGKKLILSKGRKGRHGEYEIRQMHI